MSKFCLSIGEWFLYLLAPVLLIFSFLVFGVLVIGLMTLGYFLAVIAYGVSRRGWPRGLLGVWKPALSFVVVVLIFWFVVIDPFFPLTPEIGRDLPNNFKQAEQVFSRRVSESFPPGTAEAVVVSTLEGQGFEVTGRWAIFEKPGFPCARIWRVRWSVDEGNRTITDISAFYGGVCL